MKSDYQKVKVYLDRVKRELKDENNTNEVLKLQLKQHDGDLDIANQKLKDQIDKMKDEMRRISGLSINIAKDPANAIMQISDPILDLLNLKVDDA